MEPNFPPLECETSLSTLVQMSLDALKIDKEINKKKGYRCCKFLKFNASIKPQTQLL